MRGVLAHSRTFALALVAFGSVACGGSAVDRVRDGVVVRGRYVSEAAYAESLAGAIAEAKGDLSSARRHYEHALDETDDAWLRAHLETLGRPAERLSPRDALSKALASPPSDAALLDAAEAVGTSDEAVPLRAWLLGRAIESMARGERSVTTPRAGKAIVALAKQGRGPLARRLARALVLRAERPYGGEAEHWLVVRLASDASLEEGSAEEWSLVRRRAGLTTAQMAARARVLGLDDAARAIDERSASDHASTVASEALDPAAWMVVANELCDGSKAAYEAWSRGKRPPALEGDPLWARFNDASPCHEASRRQSTASTGRSNAR